MKIILKNTAVGGGLKTDLLVLPAASSASDGGGTAAGKKAKRSPSNKSPKGPLDAFDGRSAAVIRELDRLSGHRVRSHLERFEYRPAAGKRTDAALETDGLGTLRLSGLSALDARKEGVLDEWRKLGGDTLSSAKRLKARKVSIALAHVPASDLEEIMRAVTEGIVLASYEFTRYKSAAKKKKAGAELGAVEFLVSGRIPKTLQAAVQRSQRYAESVLLARDLVNTPPSDLSPKVLVAQARRIAAKRPGRIKLKVFNQAALQRMKAFALLGVSRGSNVEPYMLHMTYTPRKRVRGAKTVVYIGKGITFDSGGLSIKSGKGMEDMKCDMAGAACVLAVMDAIASMPAGQEPEHEVHVIVPTAENMISGRSIKPGDVIAAMNGKTIEVLNTDAEGRLILADALSYSGRIESDIIVDLATLTGACVVALGGDYAGLFSNDRGWGDRIRSASEDSGEKLWPLPLAVEYRPQMESDVADLRNIGTGGPGAIIGALFLKEFVPSNRSWVHLDIAGPAFVTKGNEYLRRGGTGFGVLTLLRLLERLN